jgi:hypothetical protein
MEINFLNGGKKVKKILIYIALLGLIEGCSVPQNEFDPLASKDQTPKWTLLIYMNGDDSVLDPYVALDLQEIQYGLRYNNVEVIVLVDRLYSGAKLIRYTNPENDLYPKEEILSGEINGAIISPSLSPEITMTDQATLSSFIDYGKSIGTGDNYALFLWSHSDGWRARAITSDANTVGGTSFLSNQNIASALSGKNIDVLIFDSCLQGTIETLWAFKNQNGPQYIIASPVNVPATGQDYQGLIKSFQHSYKRIDDLLYSVVSSYADYYSKSNLASLLAYDLNKFDKTLVSDFISYVNGVAGDSEKNIFNSDDTLTPESGKRDFYKYVGLSGYSNKAAVLSMLSNTIRYSWHYSQGYGFKSMSIYNTSFDSDYSKAQIPFLNDTLWLDTLQAWGQ